MSTRIVLITNPAHDKVTKYLRSWSEALIVDIKNRLTNIDIHELKTYEVIKINLVKIIKRVNPCLVLFHGHGSNKVICGFKKNILISCDDNEKLLKGKIVHSLTCASGEELGPKCISNGSKAFIGYKKDFKFAHLGKKGKMLQQTDTTAEIFLRPAFEINRALLEGNKIKQAYKRSQQLYADNLQLLLTSNNPTLNKVYASGLYHDMMNQVVLGDKNCSF